MSSMWNNFFTMVSIIVIFFRFPWNWILEHSGFQQILSIYILDFKSLGSCLEFCAAPYFSSLSSFLAWFSHTLHRHLQAQLYNNSIQTSLLVLAQELHFLYNFLTTAPILSCYANTISQLQLFQSAAAFSIPGFDWLSAWVFNKWYYVLTNMSRYFSYMQRIHNPRFRLYHTCNFCTVIMLGTFAGFPRNLHSMEACQSQMR